MNPSPHGGRELVAIPGPSVVPDRVLAAMHRAMPDIYGGELVEVLESVFDDLPAVARTAGTPFIALGNGHAAWEMAVTNTLSAGDKVLVLESGQFPVTWGSLASVAGVDVEVLPGTPDGPVDPAAVEARLRRDTTHELRAVLMVQVDTGTSVRNDVPAVRRALDAAGHPALLMVDAIASLGCERFEMDEWGVDVTVSASQKGLMVPPGLGLVWAGEKAWAAHRTAGLRTGYWDWTARNVRTPHYLRFCGTPPVSHLFGLRVALDMLLEEEGLERVWARHEMLAGAVRAAVEAWAAPGGLALNIVDPAARSNAVTTVLTGAVDVDALRALCQARAGLTLGTGISGFEGRAFRIGHMGHVNAPMILGVLGTVEAALHALGAPLGGSGVAAAAAAIGGALAR